MKYKRICDMKRIVLFFAVFLTLNGLGQDVSLGLQFTPPEQLQGIPLASTPFSGEELPERADLSSKMPPAGNQGKQNSCVGWAVAYACKSYQEKVEENVSFTVNGNLDKTAVFSPAFIYNQINNGVDGGSLFVDALNLLSQQGAVKWSDMPYDVSDFTTRPTETMRNKAKKYRIDFWRKVNYADIKEVKAQINAGYPVVFGANVDRAFINDGKNSNGQEYIWKTLKGEQLGGHAMIAVGYDNAKNAVLVLNSWGTKWGKDGYCWIDYSLFTKVVREAFVMKDAINSVHAEAVSNIAQQEEHYALSNDKANLIISEVQHNVEDYDYGLVMMVGGTVDIPEGIGNKAQVVIRFYLNDGNNGKGEPVESFSFLFMMPDGTAACGTPQTVVESGKDIPWFAGMPYTYLDVPTGYYDDWGLYQTVTTYLIAEPILYVDDFAVATGELIPFYVNL